MQMRKITVKFPADMERAIKRDANKKGVSFGHVVRECVGARLKVPKPLRQGDKGWRPPSAGASTD
jgi:hypothetical protein